MIKTTYLDYYKTILEKVSFDPMLFEKEYRKALRILSKRDALLLEAWLHMRWLGEHPYMEKCNEQMQTDSMDVAING